MGMVKIKWCPVFTEKISFDPNISYFEPEPAFKYLTTIRDEAEYLRCPALRNFLRNTFVIKAPYNYKLTIDPVNGNVTSDKYGQEFFNINVNVKKPFKPKDKLIIQTFPKYLFMSNHKKPVNVSVLPWFFKPNNFSVIPGSFDITKWLRPVNLALEAHGQLTFDFRRGEPLYCVRFECEDDVELERIDFDVELQKSMASCVNVQNYVHGLTLKTLYEQGANYINLVKKRIFK